jgi:hypothetical protein
MRVFAIVGAAVIALGAATVPLPWAVVEDTAFLPAADVTDITIEEELEQSGAAGDGGVSGEYLTVRHRDRAAAVRLLAAAVAPRARVERAGNTASPRGVDPVVTAVMAGVGIVPRYADVSELPVTAGVHGEADSRSLGVALYAFDVGSPLDVAQGRRVAGLGRVLDGGSLVCTPGVAASARAAAQQSVDVIVVPSECVTRAMNALPADTEVRVLHGPVLASAAEALLDS